MPVEKYHTGIFQDKKDAYQYQQKSPEYFTVAHCVWFYWFVYKIIG